MVDVFDARSGNDELAADDSVKRGVTESPSRLPHRRIAAWARELMDDLQSIDDAYRGPNKDSGDDPGDSLAIKRYTPSPSIRNDALTLVSLA